MTDLSLTLCEHEAQYVAAMLLDCDGNISMAAARLGIARSSLQRKMLREPLYSMVKPLVQYNQVVHRAQRARRV